jgi:hypothetical protein
MVNGQDQGLPALHPVSGLYYWEIFWQRNSYLLLLLLLLLLFRSTKRLQLMWNR